MDSRDLDSNENIPTKTSVEEKHPSTENLEGSEVASSISGTFRNDIQIEVGHSRKNSLDENPAEKGESNSGSLDRKIPDAIPEPIRETLTEKECQESSIVVFTVETTGLEIDADLCKLTAFLYQKDDSPELLHKFEKFIMPTKAISFQASSKNKIKKIGQQLRFNGRNVQSESTEVVLEKFLNFLNQIKSSVVLLAHNCFRFQERMLLGSVVNCHFEEKFKEKVRGIVDILPICQIKFQGLENYTLKSLYSNLEMEGVEDYRKLHFLVKKLDLTSSTLSTNSRSLSYSFRYFVYRLDGKKREITFLEKGMKGKVKIGMIKKMSRSGLEFNDLWSLRNDPDKIKAVLSAETNGKARVTKISEKLEEICEFFASVQT